jgi:ADP-heptose:LPS heptosyltransferase
MREVAASLQKLDLLICNEGALNHLSCATQTKTLCLIGPTDAATWSPQEYFPHHYHMQNTEKKF